MVKGKQDDESYLKEKYLEMQYLAQHMELVQQQVEKINGQMEEIMLTKSSLVEFSSVKKGKEMMVSVSNGIFAKASLIDPEKLLVNVGNNVVVEKSVEDTINLLDEQLMELGKYQMQLTAQQQTLSRKVEEVEKEVEKRINHV